MSSPQGGSRWGFRMHVGTYLEVSSDPKSARKLKGKPFVTLKIHHEHGGGG